MSPFIVNLFRIKHFNTCIYCVFSKYGLKMNKKNQFPTFLILYKIIDIEKLFLFISKSHCDIISPPYFENRIFFSIFREFSISNAKFFLKIRDLKLVSNFTSILYLFYTLLITS